MAEAEVLELRVQGRAIGTTLEHPFFVRGQGWTKAQDLRPGDQLRLEAPGWLPVEAVEHTGRIETVYNVAVEDDHTYFVGSPNWAWAVWAHNACKGPSGKLSTTKYLAKRWDKGTFGNVSKSIEYHVAKHGQGLSAVEYTKKAMKAFTDAMARTRRVTDIQGRPAIRVISPEFGEGLFTLHGRIIWFHPKMP